MDHCDSFKHKKYKTHIDINWTERNTNTKIIGSNQLCGFIIILGANLRMFFFLSLSLTHSFALHPFIQLLMQIRNEYTSQTKSHKTQSTVSACEIWFPFFSHSVFMCDDNALLLMLLLLWRFVLFSHVLVYSVKLPFLWVCVRLCRKNEMFGCFLRDCMKWARERERDHEEMSECRKSNVKRIFADKNNCQFIFRPVNYFQKNGFCSSLFLFCPMNPNLKMYFLFQHFPFTTEPFTYLNTHSCIHEFAHEFYWDRCFITCVFHCLFHCVRYSRCAISMCVVNHLNEI